MNDSTFRGYLKEVKKTPKKVKEFSSRRFLISSIVFAVVAIALPVSIFLVSNQQDIRQRASDDERDKKYKFIMLAADSSQFELYQGLENSSTSVAYRTVDYDPSSEISEFEENGWDYYVTVASSDFPAYQEAPYLYNYNTSQLQSIALNKHFKGFYLHEMMTYRASINNWDWNTARDTVDWGYLDQIFAIAQSREKKVVWSEPTNAWKTMYESQAVNDKFALWNESLVPMYATNFTREETASALEYSKQVSKRYNTPLGISHQGWYWRDVHTQEEPTKEESFNLANEGKVARATYFQFEGAPEDFLWESPYMQGVQEFASSLRRSNRRR